MRCFWNEFDHRLATHLLTGYAVTVDAGMILAAHQQQAGDMHLRQQLCRQIRPAATRNHRMDLGRAACRCDHGSRRAGARPIQADPHAVCFRIYGKPIDHNNQALGRVEGLCTIMEVHGISAIPGQIHGVGLQDGESVL
jgi:hypothetical protein